MRLRPYNTHLPALAKVGRDNYWLLALFFCFTLISAVDEDCHGPRTPDDLREKLWGSEAPYSRRTRPTVSLLANKLNINPAHAEPEKVQVQLHVLSLRGVDQTRGEITLMTWFRQKWNDYRLSYSTAAFGGCFPDGKRQGFDEEDLKEIWKPDVRPANLVSTPTQVASSFWIYPNGDVLYAQSLLMTVSCKFELKNFPEDTQNCSVVVGTWKEDADEVQLGFLEDADPVTVAKPSELGNAISGTNEWDIIAVGGEDDLLASASYGSEESTVQFEVDIKRKSEYYTDFVMVPCLLIVILSWATFFIDRKSAPARTAMAIVCFLTNTNFLSTQLASLPRVSNEILMLRLLTVSQIFSFYAVIEYVICNYLVRAQRRIEKGQESIIESRAMGRTKMLELCSTDSDRSDRSWETTMRVDLEQYDINKTPTKAEMIRNGYKYKIDLLLLRKDGHMHFADEHVEVLSRWLYPIAYITSVSAMYYVYDIDA